VVKVTNRSVTEMVVFAAYRRQKTMLQAKKNINF